MCSPFLASIEVPEAHRTLALKGLQGQPIQTLSIGDESKFLRREIHALSGTQLAEVTAVGLEAWSFPCTSWFSQFKLGLMPLHSGNRYTGWWAEGPTRQWHWDHLLLSQDIRWLKLLGNRVDTTAACWILLSRHRLKPPGNVGER